jgi:hypothetical protein
VVQQHTEEEKIQNEQTQVAKKKEVDAKEYQAIQKLKHFKLFSFSSIASLRLDVL